MAATSKGLKLACPALDSLGPNKWDRCDDNPDIIAAINGAAEHKGIIGEAIILIGTNPSADETVVIGAETWTFKVAAGSTSQVTIGGDADESIVNLVTAINTYTALNIKASAITGVGMKIQFADGPNGTPVVGTPTSYALSETLSAPADVWNQANLNALGQTNHLYETHGHLSVTAQNLAAPFQIPLAFVPTHVDFFVRDASGLPKPTCTSVVTLGASFLTVDFDNGGDPAVATDVLCFSAYGSELV